jgi:hypothetical protein
MRNAVQIQLGASPLVAEALRPRVVLDAAVFCKEELMEQPDGPCWQTMQGFGEVSKSKSSVPCPIRPRTCTVSVLVLASPSSGILVCAQKKFRWRRNVRADSCLLTIRPYAGGDSRFQQRRSGGNADQECADKSNIHERPPAGGDHVHQTAVSAQLM